MQLFNMGLAAGLSLQAGIATLLVGPAGVGKTEIAEGMCRSLGYHFCGTIIGTQCDPGTDFGMPVLVTDPDTGEQTVVKLPGHVFREAIAAAGRGQIPVIFFDELNTCSPLVRAAMLTVIQSKLVGDVRLPSETRFIAAMNPPDIAPNATDIMPPTASRYLWLGFESERRWRLPLDFWRRSKAQGFPDPELLILPDDWESHIPAAAGLVDAFLSSNPEAYEDDQDIRCVNTPVACPRTWTWVERVLAACESVHAPFEVMEMCLSGLVGKGNGLALMEFRKLRDLADVDLCLAHAGPIPQRGDVCFLLFEAASVKLREEPTVQRWQQFWNLYAASDAAGMVDYALPGAEKVCRQASPKLGDGSPNPFYIQGALKALPKGMKSVMEIFRMVGMSPDASAGGAA